MKELRIIGLNNKGQTVSLVVFTLNVKGDNFFADFNVPIMAPAITAVSLAEIKPPVHCSGIAKLKSIPPDDTASTD